MAKADASPTTIPDSAASIFALLSAPFEPGQVQWRVGSTNKKKFEAKQTDKRRGKPLCYIDARDVMDRLDAVMGAHWQTDPLPLTNGVVSCKIGLLVEGDWLWRGDGAGATDVEGPKGAFSDALKRAAVQWGIGRYLYGIDAPWIDLDEWWGIPKETYPKLQALLGGGEQPQQKSAYAARREGHFPRVERRLRGAKTMRSLAAIWKAEQQVIAQWPTDWQAHITEEKNRCKEDLEAKGRVAAQLTMQQLRDSVEQLNGSGSLL